MSGALDIDRDATVRAIWAAGREPKDLVLARDVHLNVVLLAGRSLDVIEELCRAEGISHQQYVALWTLCLAEDAESGMPLGAIADGLLTRASDITRLVDRLERAGLVERLANPADRRSVLVRATADGQRVFAAVTPKVQEFHRRQWSKLSRDELRTLHALLGKAMWGSES